MFASGSPFPPVQYNGKTYYPGQGNNSYIFPGVALGVICSGTSTIPEDIFLISAERLAEMVTSEDLNKGSLYPPLETIRECSLKIATKVMEYSYEKGELWMKNDFDMRASSLNFNYYFVAPGLASVRPEPVDKESFIKTQTYDLSYQSALPEVYSWPKM